jgi:hypothetical protein
MLSLSHDENISCRDCRAPSCVIDMSAMCACNTNCALKVVKRLETSPRALDQITISSYKRATGVVHDKLGSRTRLRSSFSENEERNAMMTFHALQHYVHADTDTFCPRKCLHDAKLYKIWLTSNTQKRNPSLTMCIETLFLRDI